ncbi:hypothetical protein BDK51DRAFT_41681 [Blyttiomyces helicus]|uniref:Uncharacterized protein n=1 Tax=Blyttiomyces helicus TaxID=388810 RepID=A0A4P9WHT7_9FUNG|nr:hypothetical protein BDK51DRAFT_41681 [Blyttiomyces helicus]|eukprot:RKO92399.1 hypothetical protein BDK51DRAFT_41681 [Blyttiomyces helicus]
MLLSSCLDERSLAIYYARCRQLLKVDLSNSAITDEGVNHLLDRTKITATTINPLQQHPPLTFLGVGDNSQLLENRSGDIPIAALILLRGSNLKGLAVGSGAYRLSAELAFALFDACSRLVALWIYSATPYHVLVSLARHLPCLQSLAVGEPSAHDQTPSVSTRLHMDLSHRIDVKWFDQWQRRIVGFDVEVLKKETDGNSERSRR